ncbi:MAG: glycosyltransferase [Rhodospirillales bacterium]|nr:glycosyltransferase [Rhodospirillales bacterium]
MEIAFFIPDFKGGGAQRMIVNMANEFARRDHNTTLLLLNRDGPYQDKVSHNVKITSFEKDRAFKAFFRLRRYLKENRPDVVISALFHVNVLLVLARLSLPGLNTKIIVTERNHFSMRVKNSDRALDKLFPPLVFLLYRFADKVIGISKGVADDIRQSARLPEDKVDWIHNPVVTADTLEELKKTIKKPWFEHGTEPVIVTSGRLVPQKDYETLFRAMAELVKTRKARLLILGTGPLREKLGEFARDLNIREYIHFAGFVENPLPYMKKADLFVMSSHWEGFCNVIVEALLCGLPIVATDCPSGPAEILDNGTYGTLVPVGDYEALAAAMAAALDAGHDPKRQKRRAMDFTVEHICNQYLNVIESLPVLSKRSEDG